MPSKTPAQAKMMRAVANNPAFAKKVNVPQSVGQEFVAADKKAGKPPVSTGAKAPATVRAKGK